MNSISELILSKADMPFLPREVFVIEGIHGNVINWKDLEPPYEHA